MACLLDCSPERSINRQIKISLTDLTRMKVSLVDILTLCIRKVFLEYRGGNPVSRTRNRKLSRYAFCLFCLLSDLTFWISFFLCRPSTELQLCPLQFRFDKPATQGAVGCAKVYILHCSCSKCLFCTTVVHNVLWKEKSVKFAVQKLQNVYSKM